MINNKVFPNIKKLGLFSVNQMSRSVTTTIPSRMFLFLWLLFEFQSHVNLPQFLFSDFWGREREITRILLHFNSVNFLLTLVMTKRLSLKDEDDRHLKSWSEKPHFLFALLLIHSLFLKRQFQLVCCSSNFLSDMKHWLTEQRKGLLRKVYHTNIYHDLES